MAQLDVYRNNRKDSKAYPYFVDVQYDLLSSCSTRIVVPLMSAKVVKESNMSTIEGINPVFVLGDTEVILAAQLMTAVSARDLREKVGSIAYMRTEIFAAIDVLFSGF